MGNEFLKFKIDGKTIAIRCSSISEVWIVQNPREMDKFNIIMYNDNDESCTLLYNVDKEKAEEEFESILAFLSMGSEVYNIGQKK